MSAAATNQRSGLEFCTDQELRQAQVHLINNMRERGISIAAGDSLFAMVGGVVSNKLADVMAMAIHMELVRREVAA